MPAKRPLSVLLRDTIHRELPHLRAADPARLDVHPNGPHSWSPKQELGHLIDSAANNHQRFVRAALESEYTGPGYAQDAWVSLHNYKNLPWETLVTFWFEYNQLLAELLDNIPPNKLDTWCTIGAAQPVTLAFLIEDYVKHMRHHLDKILARDVVTQYP